MESAPKDIHASQPPSPEPSALGDVLRFGRETDLRGDRIHTVLAALFCYTLPLATSLSGITFALLVVFAAIRLPHTWRSYAILQRAPYTWAVVVWIGYFALSLAWSPDPFQGLDELGAARVLLVPFAVWPVIDRAPLLIGAALAGVATQNAAQLLQLVGIVSRDDHAAPGRVGGLIHPIQTATWCVAAMTWHLAALLTTMGRRRLLWLAGLVVAAAGLVATGSRGPMLGAMVSLPLALVVIAVRYPSARRTACAVAILGVIAAAAAVPLVKPRIEGAMVALRAAREHGDYWSPDARRLGLWAWALDLFAESPMLGTGAGGYTASLPELPAYRRAVDRCYESAREVKEGKRAAERLGARRAAQMTEGHAHSIYLHTLACQGVVGAAIGAFLLGAVLVASWRSRRGPLFAAGTTFVLIGWLVGAQFDCHHLNGHLLGLFALVAAVSLASCVLSQDP